jgi:hypothetical protein
MRLSFGKTFKATFANSLNAYIPEVWAQESLMILENQMVMASLVHRDFEDEVSQFGDVVNTRQPATFEGKRKVDGDAVTNQNATATNVPVKLDQHIHTSFIIYDGEESKGFKKLRDEYLVPAVMSIAQTADEVVAGELYNFINNNAGKLGTDPTIPSLTRLRRVMTNNKCPINGRNLVIPASIEEAFLGIDTFTEADKVGDEGTALREGSLGRKFGFNIFMSQNMPDLSGTKDTVTGAINNASGEAAGQTALTVDGFSAVITNGTWCTVAGDMTPQLITGTTGGTNPTALTVSPGLQYDTLDDAVVTLYDPFLVNLGAGYALGWTKPLVVDGLTNALEKGQMVSQGATVALLKKYGLINTPTTTSITLNRSLETALSDDDPLFPGPNGSYGFSFHRNAVAFVNRPLATPEPGTGAKAFVASYNDVSMRVTISYDATNQGHRVTVDMLCGVKTLDTNLGAVLLG